MVQEKQAQEEQQASSWETETGLPNDFDGWVTNPRFGVRDEYAAKVAESGGGEAPMLLLDLVDENGELMNVAGFSIGTGWTISEDGLVVSHIKRVNVVTATLYGQLQNRVRKELGVKMEERGLPTHAMSWNGLGFHWMLEEHPVVQGPPKTGLMPTEFLGEKEVGAGPVKAPAPAVKGISADLEKTLKELAQQNVVKEFQKLALKIPEVVADDELMASVLDEGPTGFHTTHQ